MFNNFVTAAFPALIMFAVSLLTFGVMFFVKKPIIELAAAIFKTNKSGASTARNSVAGIITSVAIAVGFQYTMQALFNFTIVIWWGIAAGFIATLLYLFIENIRDGGAKKFGKEVKDIIGDTVELDTLLDYIKKTYNKAVDAQVEAEDNKTKNLAETLVGNLTSVSKK